MVKKVLMVFLLFIVLPVSASAGEKWETLMLTDCCHQLFSVSSELDAPKDPTKFGKYGAQNLFDNNPATCWAESAPDSGIGQKIQVAVRKIPDMVYFVNGYGKNRDLFHKNNRIKTIKLTCFAAFSIEGHCTEQIIELNTLKYPLERIVTLADQPEKQKISFPFDRVNLNIFLKHAKTVFFQTHPGIEPENVRQVLLISFEIRSVYQGNKWNDTCLSELSFFFPSHSTEKIVTAITTNEAENTVFLKYSDGTRDTLINDSNSVFQIVELSPDKQWVILIQMPTHPAPGRVATHYMLYNICSKEKVLPSFSYPNIGTMYGFEAENGTFNLQYENTENGDIQLLNLKTLQKQKN